MACDLEIFVAEEWGMKGITIAHFATRENEIFRAEWDNKSFAVKLARPAYHVDATLRSELQFTAYLNESGLRVAKPVAAVDGDFLKSFDGRFVSVSHWLEGYPLSDLSLEADLQECFYKTGASLARLHDLADGWRLPDGFERPSWGLDGLLGVAPFWGRFWEHPVLIGEERHEFETFRHEARHALDRLELDFGLIHADAVRENVFVNGREITLIDFDDFGFGYRLFDLATALLKNDAAPHFSNFKSALLDGYHSERMLDVANLPLFMALRASTYLGWIISRPELDKDGARSGRYKQHALKYIRQWRET